LEAEPRQAPAVIVERGRLANQAHLGRDLAEHIPEALDPGADRPVPGVPPVAATAV
jgi:hypothetical protein